MSSPANASTLSGYTQTFSWDAGTGVSQYWLSVGSTVGATNYLDQSTGTNRTASAPNMPFDGSAVFVRLWSLIGSSWQFNDYTYTAFTGPVPAKAVMTTPATSATLSGPSTAFSWSTGTNVSQYWLYVGTTAGGADLYNQSTGLSQAATVTGLPQDSRALYVRLYSLIGTHWLFNDYTYTAASPVKAVMSTPVPATTLLGSTSTFTWTGAGASQYWLYVGSSAGGSDIYNQSIGTATSVTVRTLPLDGRTLHARLFSLIGTTWQFNDYTYTAASSTNAVMSTPAAGSILAGPSTTFTWTAGSQVNQYWLSVGTTAGGFDLYNQSTSTNLTTVVNGLPLDGRTVFVRLWSQAGSNWAYNDYTYTSSTAASAVMSAPTAGSILAGTSTTFTWTAGNQVSAYWLSVGTSVGANQLHNASSGTNTSATVSTLPVDGRTLYVRLYSLIGTNWLYNDYTYTAAAITAAKALMSSPTPGSSLTSASVAFGWTAGAGVSQYWLDVGSTGFGSKNIYTSTVAGTSMTVTGLPASGAVYVRIWSLINGIWQFSDTLYPGAGTVAYLNLDLNAPLNYTNPSLPPHYDATLLATRNQTTNVVTDKGATVGRVLFNDQRLSFNDTKSCASCHAQTNGFVDQNQFSTGFAGGLTSAHAMRLGNAAFYTGNVMFWNKRAATLEVQATQPIQNATEMGFDATHGGFAALIAKMQSLPYYSELMTWAFGDSTITETRVQNALAQFERAMVSTNSKWDRAYAVIYSSNAGGNSNANFARPLSGANIPAADRFTAQEEQGRAAFMTPVAAGGAGCAGCHRPPTFSLAPNSRSNGLDAGETTIFKSPSLKNIALSGRFMHDGRFSTLDQVMAHYSSGIKAGTALDPRLPAGGLNISASDQAALVAFMNTLTDTTLNTDARFSNPFIK